MTGTRPLYSESDIRDLAEIARGRRDKHIVDTELLQKRLNDWLWTNDLVDLSRLPEPGQIEHLTAFREFAALEPSHSEVFQYSHLLLKQRLRGMLHNRPSH